MWWNRKYIVSVNIKEMEEEEYDRISVLSSSLESESVKASDSEDEEQEENNVIGKGMECYGDRKEIEDKKNTVLPLTTEEIEALQSKSPSQKGEESKDCNKERHMNPSQGLPKKGLRKKAQGTMRQSSLA